MIFVWLDLNFMQTRSVHRKTDQTVKLGSSDQLWIKFLLLCCLFLSSSLPCQRTEVTHITIRMSLSLGTFKTCFISSTQLLIITIPLFIRSDLLTPAPLLALICCVVFSLFMNFRMSPGFDFPDICFIYVIYVTLVVSCYSISGCVGNVVAWADAFTFLIYYLMISS